MKYLCCTVGLLTASVAFLSSPSSAQQLVANYNAWRVFTVNQDGQKLCYLASLPTKKRGNYSKRDEPYLLVTHKDANIDEISVSSGYKYKNKKDVVVNFGKKTFNLFTKGELAWAYDSKSDMAIVKDMMAGARMEVKGTSWKGTHSTDSYSLKGFTAAHRRMKKECK